VILANPAYLGLIRWNGKLYDGQHEPLIDKTTFEQAQQILARRFKDATLRRGNPTPFLLSGLVRCQHCGRAYVGTSAHGRNARYTYYACSTRYKYGRARCAGQRLSKDRLEHAVLAQLATIYRDGQLINDALAQAAEQASTDRPQHEQQLAGVRADIQNLERKIDSYLQAFEDSKLDPDICQQRIERHHTRLQALRDQEDQLTQTLAAHADTQPDTASLAAIADQLDQLIATANPEQAKELLRLLIKDIRVHDQHTIIPTYRVPPAIRTMHGTVATDARESQPTAERYTRHRTGAVRCAARGLMAWCADRPRMSRESDVEATEGVKHQGLLNDRRYQARPWMGGLGDSLGPSRDHELQGRGLGSPFSLQIGAQWPQVLRRYRNYAAVFSPPWSEVRGAADLAGGRCLAHVRSRPSSRQREPARGGVWLGRGRSDRRGRMSPRAAGVPTSSASMTTTIASAAGPSHRCATPAGGWTTT
jgi:hypothetical protein